MKRFIFSIIICIFTFIHCSATISSDTIWTSGTIDDNFNFINKEIKLDSLERRYQKHGYFRDNCIEFTDLDCFNKTTICDSNFVTRSIFSDLLRSASTLTTPSANWTAEDVFANQSSMNSVNNCPIAIILYMYIQLKENALNEGLVNLNGDYVKDVYINGVHQNPYEDGVLFAFSPSDTLFYNQLTFSFPDEIYKKNFSPQIEFDADDGLGFRSIVSNGIVAVSYQSGKHHLKMRMRYGTQNYYAHCFITTVDPSVQTRSMDGCVSIPLSINNIEGYLTKKIRNGNNVTRPFLFVEGFDPDMLNNVQSIDGANENKYGNLGYKSVLMEPQYDNLVNNFDVYYLDFKDCTLSIKENAKLLEMAIESINNDRNSNSYPLVVMGSSMGGLIARYCLRRMELDGKSHKVSTLICQDTPNLGANIPLGLLYASHAFLKMYNRYVSPYYDVIGDELTLLKKYVYCQSAKEMLYNFVNENGYIDNSVHLSFVQELHQMGYPVGDDGTLRCIAISNGNEQIVSATESLLKLGFEVKPSVFVDALLTLISSVTGPILGVLTKDIEVGLLETIPGAQKLSCKAEINPTGSGRDICDIRLIYKKKIFDIFNSQKTFFKYIKSDPSNNISYDLAKGSYYDTDYILSNLNTSAGKKEDNFLGSLNIDFEIKQKFLFVPTASALDIGEGIATLTQTDYSMNYEMQNRGAKPKHSPFHAYYVSQQSEEHIQMNNNILSWLMSQLQTQMVGESIGMSGYRYSISNLPLGESVTWSSSSPTIASIDGNGVISQHEHGYVSIMGQLSNGMQFTKRIMIGLPPYTIESRYTSSGYYTNLAINTNPSEFLRYQQYIKCDLAIRNSSNQIEWVERPEMYYWVPLEDTNNSVSVYYRLRFTNSKGDVILGPTVYRSINPSKPYIVEPNYFASTTYSGIQNVVLKPNPAFSDPFTDDFKIYHFESHGGIPPFCSIGVTQITLTPNNVFSSAQIQSFLGNANIHTITNDFIIRNNKGEPIQSFNISIVKP